MKKSNTIFMLISTALGLTACGTSTPPVEIAKNTSAEVDYSRTARVIHVSENGTTDTREAIKTVESASQLDRSKITALCRDGSYSSEPLTNACTQNGGIKTQYSVYKAD